MDQEIKNSEEFIRAFPVEGGFNEPVNYFEELDADILLEIRLRELISKNENIEIGFEVPGSYFETLTEKIQGKVEEKGAKKIALFGPYWLSKLTGIAAIFIMLVGLVFFRSEPKSISEIKLTEEDIANELSLGDLNAVLLCDAGWCNELEGLGQTNKKNSEIWIEETDLELIIEEL
ncbi:MAG: hypothetical protein K9H61_13705 [Bacteroidia bacterium]|nr:hypothetical protein [Bacteroidia bacterium]MCF8427012.1 hypothetical protein [Bacteroidia bacterium]MCF8448040.1 hypothetical protein [Bacteroidia bacterium]